MPSKEHYVLSGRAIPWLRGRCTRAGIRGAHEVSLAAGYTADVVALCSFQYRFDHDYIQGPVREYSLDGWPISPELICVFETKVSRADFAGTFTKGGRHSGDRMIPRGSLHWVIAPKGLLPVEDIPTFWGLLEVAGSGLRETKRAQYHVISREKTYEIAYWILRAQIWAADGERLEKGGEK